MPAGRDDGWGARFCLDTAVFLNNHGSEPAIAAQTTGVTHSMDQLFDNHSPTHLEGVQPDARYTALTCKAVNVIDITLYNQHGDNTFTLF
jgi:hypothetical protein